MSKLDALEARIAALEYAINVESSDHRLRVIEKALELGDYNPANADEGLGLVETKGPGPWRTEMRERLAQGVEEQFEYAPRQSAPTNDFLRDNNDWRSHPDLYHPGLKWKVTY